MVKEYEAKIQKLEAEIEKISRQKDVLEKKLFSVEKFNHQQSSMLFYTGFPNYDAFIEIFTYLDPGERGQNIRYYTNSTSDISQNVYNQEEVISESKKRKSKTPKTN